MARTHEDNILDRCVRLLDGGAFKKAHENALQPLHEQGQQKEEADDAPHSGRRKMGPERGERGGAQSAHTDRNWISRFCVRGSKESLYGVYGG